MSSSAKATQTTHDAIADLCVLGMGVVGAPSAAWFAGRGLRVCGVDTNPEVLRAIRSGARYHDEPTLPTRLTDALTSGALTLHDTPQPARVYLIAVPTLRPWRAPGGDVSDGLEAVRAATQALIPTLTSGALVLVESTVPPGTTEREVARALTRAGWTVGEDCHVAHCPERVLPGDAMREIVENDRIVGGVTPSCTEAARAFYAPHVQGTLRCTTARVSELTKLAENTFRDVNIALANELAALGPPLGVDMREVFTLANTHPRVQLHQPGVGVGGMCLPYATATLADAHPDPASLLHHARRINEETTASVASALQTLCAQHPEVRTVALLGLTYKPDTASTRNAPALALYHHLRALLPTHTILCCDPVLASEGDRDEAPAPLRTLEETLHHADLLICAVAHHPFRTLATEREKLAAYAGKLLVDLCGAWSPDITRGTTRRYLGRGAPW